MMSSLFTSRKFTSGTTSSWYILPIHRSEDENNEKISSSNENNSEVKTINQINQVDNTDKNDPDQDKFNDFAWYILPIHRSEDENNEKISSSNENNSEVKTINQINQVDNTDKNDPDQDKFNDFGNYSEKYLKAIGVLVQVRTYKNPTELLLKKFDKTIQIKAGQKVCFYKFGPLIHLITEEGVHDLDIKPKDIRDIFNEYTKEQVLASDDMKLPLPRSIIQKISKEATEEVEKRSQSNTIELHKLIFCTTCEKLKTKSHIEQHKLRCTSD